MSRKSDLADIEEINDLAEKIYKEIKRKGIGDVSAIGALARVCIRMSLEAGDDRESFGDLILGMYENFVLDYELKDNE